MDTLKSIFGSKYFLWLLLGLPLFGMANQLIQGTARYGMLMHITGEFSVRFLVVSMIATPLTMLFPNRAVPMWLLRNRRYFGVAAFVYALIHTIFYLFEESMSEVVDGLSRAGILTGWVAMLIFVPLAITSTDAAVRRMGARWKQLQRWVYLAALMSLLHWAWVSTKHTHWKPALIHFAPVIVLSLYRVWAVYLKKQ